MLEHWQRELNDRTAQLAATAEILRMRVQESRDMLAYAQARYAYMRAHERYIQAVGQVRYLREWKGA